MIRAPFGYKWVVNYTDTDGKKGMGITDHYNLLPKMITWLLESGARNICIVDQTLYKDD